MNKRKIGIKNFFENYLNNILKTSQKINFQNLQRASELITKTIKKKNLFMSAEMAVQLQSQITMCVIFLNSYQNILN